MCSIAHPALSALPADSNDELVPAAHETEYTVEDYRDHLNASRDLLEGELNHLETIDEHDLAKLPGLRELSLRDASMTDNPDSIHTRSITPIVDEDDLPIPHTLLVSRVNERINVVDHRDFDLGRGDDPDHPDRQPLPDPHQSALDADREGHPEGDARERGACGRGGRVGAQGSRGGVGSPRPGREHDLRQHRSRRRTLVGAN